MESEDGLIKGLTANELRYLEACMNVADGDGEHAAEYNLDCGELQVKLQHLIDLLSQAEAWLDAEQRGMKEKQ
jgi:hypothetical protein